MTKSIANTFILGTLLAVIVAGVISWAASQGSLMAYGVPLFALCAAFAFLVQWLVFIPSYLFQTEHYFDLCGGLTYLSVIGLALFHVPNLDARTVLIAILCSLWAIRLSSFLFLRIKAAGFDRRFTKMKTVPTHFFMTWTIQGLWVVVTLSAGLAAMTSVQSAPLGLFAYSGLALWVVGFVIEVIADRQKSIHRTDAGGKFISTGLWAWSRHPNYFGEILLWTGIAMIAVPTLQGWQWLTLISPIFVFVLLTKISGIPMLESLGKKRWGQDPEYLDYVRRTSILVPLPPGRS